MDHRCKPCTRSVRALKPEAVERYPFSYTHACAPAGPALTATQFVAGAITAEVVTLAELAAVSLLRVFPVLALTSATHTVSIVAANVSSVVFATGLVHVFCGDVVTAAFALSAHASLVTPEKRNSYLTHSSTL